jgi:hypothetical protein
VVAEEALEGCGQLLLSLGTLRLAGGFAFAHFVTVHRLAGLPRWFCVENNVGLRWASAASRTRSDVVKCCAVLLSHAARRDRESK